MVFIRLLFLQVLGAVFITTSTQHHSSVVSARATEQKFIDEEVLGANLEPNCDIVSGSSVTGKLRPLLLVNSFAS